MIVAYLVTISQNRATKLFLSLSLAVLVNAGLRSKTLILNVKFPSTANTRPSVFNFVHVKLAGSARSQEQGFFNHSDLTPFSELVQ